MQKTELPVIGGLYEHYKGKPYRVVDLVRHSESLETLVSYECLYENDLGKLWVRPLSMFMEEVEVNGKFVPRFKYQGLRFSMPMPILTPRLLLRPRQAGEGVVVAQAVRESLEHLKPWMPFAQSLPKVEEMEKHCQESALSFQRRTDMTLSIYSRDGKTFLGSTGLHRPRWSIPSFAIGYWVHKDHAGQGIITESTNALTRYAFDILKAQRVEIFCDSRNQASLGVMKKLGFFEEGRFRNDDLSPDGSLRDTIVTSRINSEGLPPLEAHW